MAEATLNDVSNAIKEDGGKDREQLRGDSLRQFFQARASNKFLKSLTQAQIDSNEQTKKQFEKEQEALKKALKTKNDDDKSVAYNKFQLEEINKHLALLTQTEVASNEQMKKRFEQEQEALRRANAKKTLGEPANDNDTRFQRIITKLIAGAKGVINVLDKMKKALPDKKTVFGLLFGGLAAAFAFFPEWSKRNLIDPLIDVINVFQGNDATTTLGSVVKALKGSLEWISENISPTAAWVVGIAGAVVALKPITTFTMVPKAFAALKAIGAFLTMPWIAGVVAIGAAILGAKLALDKLRDLSIESETELSKKSLRDYEKATDPKERERIVEEQIARLKRNQDTTLKGVSSIEDPINEILKLNKDAAESAIKQAQAAKLALAVEGDTLGGEDGSINKQITKENNIIARSIRDQVIAITEGKAPTDKEGLAEIYDILKKSIELNDAKETKAVIRGIKGALPDSFGKLSGELALLNSLIKSGEDLSLKGMEKLNLALKGEKPKPLSPEELNRSPEELNRSPEEVSNIKTARALLAEIRGVVPQDQNQAKKLAANAEDNDRSRNQTNPIVPVVASDSRDMSVTNYNITNVFGGRTDPLEGLYGGPNPSSQ